MVFEKLYEMAQQVNDEDEDDFLTQFENGELGKFLRVAIDKLPPQKQKNLLVENRIWIIQSGNSRQDGDNCSYCEIPLHTGYKSPP